MNTPRLPRWTAVLAALLGSAALGACAVENPVQKNEDAYQTEVTEACRACQEILVDCTSTSTNETQFVECRDQWLQCQQGADVGDTCGPPNDDDSCTMCRERVTGCKAKRTRLSSLVRLFGRTRPPPAEPESESRCFVLGPGTIASSPK